jgi:hypothetical protein
LSERASHQEVENGHARPHELTIRSQVHREHPVSRDQLSLISLTISLAKMIRKAFGSLFILATALVEGAAVARAVNTSNFTLYAYGADGYPSGLPVFYADGQSQSLLWI